MPKAERGRRRARIERLALANPATLTLMSPSKFEPCRTATQSVLFTADVVE